MIRKTVPATRRVYILPNLITTASMACGLLAILQTMRGDFGDACILILVSGILDLLDGKVARLTGSASSFGLQYDSLSDVVAFGVAPAVLMYSVLTQSFGLPERVASGVCVPFAICGALRLARFNVQAAAGEQRGFTGLPIPAAACAMVGLYFAIDAFGGATELEPLRAISKPLRAVSPWVVLALAYLMVSRLNYPSFKHIPLNLRKSFDALVGMVLVAGLIIVLRDHFRLIIAAVAYAYVLAGPAIGHLQNKRAAAQAAAPLTRDA